MVTTPAKRSIEKLNHVHNEGGALTVVDDDKSLDSHLDPKNAKSTVDELVFDGEEDSPNDSNLDLESNTNIGGDLCA